MPDKPRAEVQIDEDLVRGLLRQADSEVPGAATDRLRRVSEGWDSEVWRLGADRAVRLPRRAAAAPLIAHERHALAVLAPHLEATGIRVPLPVFVGRAAHGYPWPWSIVPWFEGDTGLRVPREERAGWARPLAKALVALHTPAPSDHPVNPVRGVPLVDRSPAVLSRVAQVRSEDALPVDALTTAWRAGLAAPPWRGPAVWIHGDLHPGNLVAGTGPDGGALRAIIDFGDVTAGDPAYDLSVAWLAFDRDGRALFRAALEGRYDDDTWTRARAWAAAIALMLATHSDDAPDYGRLGAESAREVSED